MRLLFSEAAASYHSYLFPYQVWAIPEDGDRIGDMLAQGFLPGRHDLSHYYLCRSVRVVLKDFSLNKRLRYTRRLCSAIRGSLRPIEQVDIERECSGLWARYVSARVGPSVFPESRVNSILHGSITSHLLYFTTQDGSPAGFVTLLLDAPTAVYYGFSFYNLEYFKQSLGLHMMCTALTMFQTLGYSFAYLGTCYQPSALYKTRFLGTEFFNGYKWSRNRAELRYLINNNPPLDAPHILESPGYLQVAASSSLQHILEDPCNGVTCDIHRCR